jgi:hypothetical protein
MATGHVQECEQTIAELNARASALLDALATKLDSPIEPSKIEEELEKIEKAAQRAAAVKPDASEFSLNESAVVLHKLHSDIDSQLGIIPDAVVCAQHENLSWELEKALGQLGKLSASVSKVNAAKKPALAIAAFRAAAEGCRKSLSTLSKKVHHPPAFSKLHKRAFAAKETIAQLQKGLHEARHTAYKRRMAKQIEHGKASLYAALSHGGRGRLCIDSKHLTIRSENRGRTAIALDEPLRYALASFFEGTPLSSKIDGTRNGLQIAATFEIVPSPSGLCIKLNAGERAIVGGNIVFHSRPVYVSLPS